MRMTSNSQDSLAMRRSKRSNAGKIGHFSPSNYNVQRKRYNLSKDKIISKITTSANKTSSAICTMTGGGLVMEFNAGTFNLFNKACHEFYTKRKGTKIEEVVDAGGIMESVIYKTGGYTNNVFLTTGKVLVNGRGLNTFVESDLAAIMTNVNLDDAEQLNKRILNTIKADASRTPANNDLRVQGGISNEFDTASEADSRIRELPDEVGVECVNGSPRTVEASSAPEVSESASPQVDDVEHIVSGFLSDIFEAVCEEEKRSVREFIEEVTEINVEPDPNSLEENGIEEEDSDSDDEESRTGDISNVSMTVLPNIIEAMERERQSSNAIIRSLKEENDALRKEIAELRKKDAEYEKVKTENILLKKSTKVTSNLVTTSNSADSSPSGGDHHDGTAVTSTTTQNVLKTDTKPGSEKPRKEIAKSKNNRQSEEVSCNTLILGDSHVRHIAEKLQDTIGVVCPGRPIEQLNVTTVNNSKNVVLMAGSNNISSKDSVQEINQKFTDIITRIKRVNKNCRLFIQEIFPRHDINRERKIRFVNETLRKTCNRFNVSIIPAPKLCYDDDYTVKGLHLNYTGKMKIAQSIESAINNFL